jgi:hypothetical protein
MYLKYIIDCYRDVGMVIARMIDDPGAEMQSARGAWGRSGGARPPEEARRPSGIAVRVYTYSRPRIPGDAAVGKGPVYGRSGIAPGAAMDLNKCR